MEMNLENQEQTSQAPLLRTTRLISFNPHIFFSCVVNESIVAYLSGRSLVLENIRTHQQTILWICPQKSLIINITSYLTLYGPFMFAIVMQNREADSQIQLLILTVDWGNYFYSKNQQNKLVLPNCHSPSHQIHQMQFVSGGSQIMLLLQHDDKFILKLLDCTTGQQEFERVLKSRISSVCCLESNEGKSFIIWNPTSLGLIQYRNRFLIEQQQKTTLPLWQNQTIIQVQFGDEKQSSALGFILTDFGNLIFFKVIGNSFGDFFKIDMRIKKDTCKIEEQKGELSSKKAYDADYFTPSCFMNRKNRIFLGYKNCRRLAFITYSLKNVTTYSITVSSEVLFVPSEVKESEKDSFERELNYTATEIALSTDLCTGALVIENEYKNRFIMVLDVLNSLICYERKENPCDKIYGNYYCAGQCISTCYLESNSSVFILHSTFENEIKLAYYSANFLEVAKLPPKGFLNWDQPIKTKAIQVCVHPVNYSIMLIHQEMIKLYNFSREKLSEAHATLNITKCSCGSFSPLGDKIILGNTVGIFVVDSYSLDILCFINSNMILNKIPKRIEFISPFDIILEFTSGNASFYATLQNFANLRAMGTIVKKTRNIRNMDRNFSCKTMEVDHERGIVILIEQGSHIQFYNKSLELINEIQIKVETVTLCRQIDMLLIGTSNGRICLLRWPQITSSPSISDATDNVMLGFNSIHCGKVVMARLSLNYRFIFTVSEHGEVGITEFMQENSSKITREAALLILKKCSLKPFSQNCLTSTSLELKRSEMITKAIGKEVEIYSRNSKQMAILKEQLEQQLVQQRERKEAEAKEDPELLEFSKKIYVLKRGFQRKQNSAKQSQNRLNQTIKEENKIFDQKLLLIFKDKDELETKKGQLILSFANQKKKEKDDYERDMLNFQTAAKIQLQDAEKGTDSSKKMFKKVMRLNQGEELKASETKEQLKEMCENQYGIELRKLQQRNQELLQMIRKNSFAISQISSKNNIFNLQIMELINDIQTIKQIKSRGEIKLSQLSAKLEEKKIIHQAKIIANRKFDETKQKDEKQAGVTQKLYYAFRNEIRGLQEFYDQIKHKKNSMDDNFYEENRKKIYLANSIASAEQKIKELKIKRNQIKRRRFGNTLTSCHSSNIRFRSSKNSNHEKSGSSAELLILKNSMHVKPTCDRGSKLHYQRDLASEKLEKLNRIKQQNVKRQKQLDDKMIDDQKKLICQLNQLKRYHQFLLRKQMKIQNQLRSIAKQQKQNVLKVKKKPTIKKGFYSAHIHPMELSLEGEDFFSET